MKIVDKDTTIGEEYVMRNVNLVMQVIHFLVLKISLIFTSKEAMFHIKLLISK